MEIVKFYMDAGRLGMPTLKLSHPIEFTLRNVVWIVRFTSMTTVMDSVMFCGEKYEYS